MQSDFRSKIYSRLIVILIGIIINFKFKFFLVLTKRTPCAFLLLGKQHIAWFVVLCVVQCPSTLQRMH